MVLGIFNKWGRKRFGQNCRIFLMPGTLLTFDTCKPYINFYFGQNITLPENFSHIPNLGT